MFLYRYLAFISIWKQQTGRLMMRCNIADCFYIFISYLNTANAAQKPTGKPPQALGNNSII